MALRALALVCEVVCDKTANTQQLDINQSRRKCNGKATCVSAFLHHTCKLNMVELHGAIWLYMVQCGGKSE